jgi:hypothetical protein
MLIASLLVFDTSQAIQQQQQPSTPDRGKEGQPQTQPTGPSRTQSEQRRESVVFLTGKVLMADGSELQEMQVVELVCHGDKSQQVYSSPSGNFTFQLGNNPMGSVADASVSRLEPFGRSSGSSGSWGSSLGSLDRTMGSNPYQVSLNGCFIRLAPRPGFQSTQIDLTSRSVLDNPDIGVLFLYDLSEKSGTTVSLTTLRAPNKAKSSFQKAQKELNKEKPNYEKAQKELEKSVETFPEFAVAWQTLGELKLEQQDVEGAQQAFQSAADADPRYVHPYLSLAQMELQAQRWEQAVQHTATVMNLGSNLSDAYYLDGIANFFAGNLETSEKSLQLLLDQGLGKQYPISYLHLGLIHAEFGNFPKAAMELRDYLEKARPGQIADEQRKVINEMLEEWQANGLLEAITPPE